ncbi:MAG: DUF1016 family protein [Lachnospiraceae bacterium]|nr:DUF1016 family protein [Lachnospiraceae bacterium]
MLCYVVLELKVKPFDPEFTGKLNFYVNAVNKFIKGDSDNPTIGLLICKYMNRTEVQLALFDNLEKHSRKLYIVSKDLKDLQGR